jgi:hypothetical protein
MNFDSLVIFFRESWHPILLFCVCVEAPVGAAMDDLGREILRLSGEIRAVEQMLVEVYGIAPVSAAAPGLVVSREHWLGSKLEHILCRLLVLAASTAMPAVRAPRPD